MNKSEIECVVRNKITNILRENQNIFSVIKPSDEKSNLDLIDDFRMDSILLIELVVELENEFGISFELEKLEIEQIRNYNRLIDYVSEKKNKNILD